MECSTHKRDKIIPMNKKDFTVSSKSKTISTRAPDLNRQFLFNKSGFEFRTSIVHFFRPNVVIKMFSLSTCLVFDQLVLKSRWVTVNSFFVSSPGRLVVLYLSNMFNIGLHRTAIFLPGQGGYQLCTHLEELQRMMAFWWVINVHFIFWNAWHKQNYTVFIITYSLLQDLDCKQQALTVKCLTNIFLYFLTNCFCFYLYTRYCATCQLHKNIFKTIEKTSFLECEACISSLTPSQ